jgi:germination protein M
MKRALLLALAMLLLVGCAGDDGEPGAETTTTPPATTEVSVYFLLNGKVWPMERIVGASELPERAALDALVAGPTEEELEDFPFSIEPFHDPGHGLEVSSDELQGLVVEGQVASIEVPRELREDGVAQVVYTLTQSPGVTAVDVVKDGSKRRLRRADLEAFTPAVLVESPLAYTQVTSPIRVTGTANTFEANFAYELKDSSGRVIAEDFVTATSGTGTRGTFEFEVPYEVSEDDDGVLVVFEHSAKDGSRMNVVEIPLRLAT